MPESSAELARRHLAARARTPARSRRQRIRLWGLRAIGWALRRRPTLPVAAPAARLLVIRPDHLGDLLFATPALTHLRRARPEAHIAALVGPWGQPVLANNPDIDDLLVCPFPGFTRRPAPSLWDPYRLLIGQARWLRQQRFDEAIILRADHWWGALLAAWAGIPIRIGYAIPEVRPFLSQARPYVAGQHAVVQNLRLIDPDLGAIVPTAHPLRFQPTVEDERWTAQQLASTTRWVAIHPGAGAPVKAWRVEAWARVGDALASQAGVRVAITGGASEAPLAQAVAAAMRHDAVILAGQTTLGQLGALLRRCALVLGPDCGPLHLATAMGAPTVHLFGPADPRLFGPWGDMQQHRVIMAEWACAPCDRLDYTEAELPEHGCVREISEERVLEAALALLP